MQDIWNRIEAWFLANVPWQNYIDCFVPLPAGASEKDIQRNKAMTNGTIHLQLPSDMCDSYAVHDGCDGIFENHRLMKVSEIPAQWEFVIRMNEYRRQNYDMEWETLRTTGPVKAEAWNPYWIPLTDTAGPSYVCTDLDPAPGGQSGQIILVGLERQFVTVLASSFRDWLSTFADELEQGCFRFDESVEMVLRDRPWLWRAS